MMIMPLLSIAWFGDPASRFNTETLLIAFDKARSVKIDKIGFKRITLQMPKSGDRRQGKK